LAVGFDGSRESESAVRWTFHEARQPQDDVIVVHAAGLLEHLRSSLPRDVTPPRLLTLARECNFDELHLRWFVDDGDACSVLLRVVAPPLNADLLVLGSRGHGTRPGLLLGSTSLEVVQHATLPVVVVPSPPTRT
jgi:nucleotide-binding universal stress UspA family protein